MRGFLTPDRLPRYFLFLWLSGLLIPYLYVLLLRYGPYVLLFVEKDIVIQFSLLFLSIQVVSTFISILLPFQDSFRYIAIFHNYICFFFFLIGYILQRYKNSFREELFRMLPIIYWFSVILSISSFTFFLLTFKPIYYKGILGLIFHVENKYTLVKLVYTGYGLGGIIPRVQIFGLYSNTAAIVMYIIYTLYLVSQNERRLYIKTGFIILSLISLATTGSRIVFLAFLLFSYFYLLEGRKTFFLSFLTIIFAFIIFSKQFHQFLSFMESLRESSNMTRIKIYQTSIELMMNYNFILGLGLKPKIPELLDFPVASHSSVIGYIVRSGIVGAVFVLSVYLLFIINLLTFILKKEYSRKEKYLVAICGLLLIYIFEDFDAYELTTFFTGILVATWRLKECLES